MSRPRRRTSQSKRPERDMAPLTKTLFKAVREEDTDCVRRLIRKDKVGINVVDPEDPMARTPLLTACEIQNLKLVEMLLKAKTGGANVNVADQRGRRPIWWAVKYGNARMAQLLTTEGVEKCDVNYIDQESGCTPLYRAILTNHAETCRQVLHAGADVNLRRLGLQGDGSSAESPLIKSVQLNNLEICQMLVNSLCDIHARTEDGYTALHYAVSFRRYEICEFLLEQGIKVHAKSHQGLTAMTIAINQHLPAMCKLLVEFGYRMNQPFEWGETPIEMAINCHSEHCAMTLLHWGCRVSLPQFNQAAEEGLTELITLLVDLNPLFLNAEWIKKENLPLALYRKPDFCHWLFQMAALPQPLTTLCRSKIFKYLGKYPCAKVTKLPLPKSMLKTLSFQEHFRDKMYRHKTLEEDNCPYDCPSMCRRQQCPPIDFSDSASDDE